jgi:hypothetical protein
MTPKEKAIELIKRYYRDSDLLVEDLTWIQAKECALIAVNEIIDSYTKEKSNGYIISDKIITYWEEVKTEINNL